MAWYSLELVGREAHTGTTPMNRRADALLAAAKMIVETNNLVVTGELSERQARATIAVINSKPQSVNTIAGHVQMSLDLRSPHDSDIKILESLCREKFDEIAKSMGVKFKMVNMWTSPAIQFDKEAVQCVREAVKEQGFSNELLSGAGHDRYVFVSTYPL